MKDVFNFINNVNKNIIIKGFLLVSCYIIGEGDRAPVHDINEVNVADEEDDRFKGIPNE
jgi:hypothetical protein